MYRSNLIIIISRYRYFRYVAFRSERDRVSMRELLGEREKEREKGNKTSRKKEKKEEENLICFRENRNVFSNIRAFINIYKQY